MGKSRIPQSSKGGANSRWLALRCKDRAFWRFLAQAFATEVCSEIDAINVIKSYGNVASRAEFDTDQAAQDRFHKLFRLPFADYCSSSHPGTN